MKSITILYVDDQTKSKKLYEVVLGSKPVLDVPGMTEFELSSTHSIGLMPRKNIHKIITGDMSGLKDYHNAPVTELYLYIDEPEEVIENSLHQGAKLLCPLKIRNWGDEVAYLMDFDGHVIGICKYVIL